MGSIARLEISWYLGSSLGMIYEFTNYEILSINSIIIVETSFLPLTTLTSNHQCLECQSAMKSHPTFNYLLFAVLLILLYTMALIARATPIKTQKHAAYLLWLLLMASKHPCPVEIVIKTQQATLLHKLPTCQKCEG
jgi:hypothetical protein